MPAQPTVLALINPLHPEAAEGLEAFIERQLGQGDWLLFQTSGTEGRAKWVVTTQAAMLASAEAVNAHLRATSNDRWLLALPTYHVGGFAIHTRAQACGASVHQLAGKWSALAFAQACETERITLTSLVPTQVYDLVASGLRAPASLRAIVVGGGALLPALASQARALGWPVLHSYGMTEAGSQIATEPLAAALSEAEPSLQVLPHWQVSVDAEQRLVLQGQALATGYAMREAQTQAWCFEAIASSGLVTRDQVELSQREGHRWLRFLGREAQAVKILGELLHLPPLQARLESIALSLGLPAHAAVIVAQPHARQGSCLALVHELPEAAQAESLRHGYNAASPSLERLAKAIALPALPRSALGKIQFAQLRQCLVAQGWEML